MESLEMVFDPLPSDALTRFVADNVINDNRVSTPERKCIGGPE